MGISDYFARRKLIKLAEIGDVEAQYATGIMYGIGAGVSLNEAESQKWLRKAAENGHVDAQYELGVMYSFEDEDESMAWFMKAAEQGHADAQYDLGMTYFRNEKYSDASKWFIMAAEQNQPDALFISDAQFMLGRMNDEGLGTEKNKAKATFWFNKAALNGNDSAQKWLETGRFI